MKACLFDLDGVIVDTARYHYIAWKALANELGFDFTEKDNERLKGVSRMDSLNILLEIGGVQLDETEKLRLASKKNEHYVDFIAKMKPDEILPGVLDFLQLLKESGVKIALGSASKNAPMILERLNLLPWFDAIIDGNSVSKAKPDPEVFLNGAKALQVDPADCIVFEDAQAGVEAAIRGGMHVVGIGDTETLNQADLVIAGFEGLTLKELEF